MVIVLRQRVDVASERGLHIYTDNNAYRLYEAVLVYLQHDMLEIKLKL